MYQRLLRPLLFRLPPEFAHHSTLKILKAAGKFSITRQVLAAFYLPEQQTPLRLFGLDFPNRVGLAAGYDKDAEAVAGLACLGFGHIEVGTVTPRPQEGNPKPRLFRLIEDEALINRMGFPGRGAEYAAQQLQRLEKPNGLILGVNIGKNKDTPLDHAYLDYVSLTAKFATLADYLAINISSPNTIGLRLLQHREYLGSLLEHIAEERERQQDRWGKNIPLLVKLAPDLTENELGQIVDTIITHGIDGIIATNTTTNREGLRSPLSSETGGLSGKPLKRISIRIIERIHQLTGGELPIIGVGGIASPEDAQEMLSAGASLIQLYTGLVYQGPGLANRILEQIDKT